MREIFFRGKRTDNGEWEYGDLWCNPYGKRAVCIVSPINDQGTTGGNEVIPETVGQYTGLTDKNGRKIFEGDIMRNAGNVVEFYGGDFCINGDSPLSYWTGTEVIGNIYDNPELLEGGNENG